jgi:hypothetical protein
MMDEKPDDDIQEVQVRCKVVMWWYAWWMHAVKCYEKELGATSLSTSYPKRHLWFVPGVGPTTSEGSP